MDRFYNGTTRPKPAAAFDASSPPRFLIGREDAIRNRPLGSGFLSTATASSNNCPSIFGRLVAGSNPARPAKTAEWKRHFLTRDAPFLYVRSDRDPAWTLDSAGTYFFFVRTGLDCAREMREGGMNGVKME